MKYHKQFILHETYKILLVAVLLLLCCLLTYYFHAVVKSGRFFNHFFYIPIILSAFWWKKKGLSVAVFSALFLLISHFIFRIQVDTYNDYLRGLLFVVTAVIVALLSEKVAESDKKLRESEVLHRVIISNIMDSIFITDSKGIFTFIASNVGGIFGYSAEEVLGLGNVKNLLGGDIIKKIPENTAARLENHEIDIRDKYGKKHHILVCVRRVDIKGGSLLYTCRDITKRKQAQELAELRQSQLIQADKMATLGILVSGMAHEINNPNSFILFNAKVFGKAWKEVMEILDDYYRQNSEFILAGLPYPEMKKEVDRLLNGIVDGAERIKKIVQNLKDFSRHDKIGNREQNFNINQAIETAALITGSLIRKSTDNFSMDLGENIPEIKGSRLRLEQVIINLLTNSCQALTDKKSKISIHSSYNEADKQIIIKVEDQGGGIDKDDLQHVKEPFHTTKKDKDGTGLGLSISNKIIQDHNGKLEIHSVKGQGATVSVALPVL